MSFHLCTLCASSDSLLGPESVEAAVALASANAPSVIESEALAAAAVGLLPTRNLLLARPRSTWEVLLPTFLHGESVYLRADVRCAQLYVRTFSNVSHFWGADGKGGDAASIRASRHGRDGTAERCTCW